MSLPQAEIFVLGGRDVGRSFLVEGAALLGRADPCDVRLNDRSVSRRHARLYSDRGRWVVEDLGSRNGLRQDGRALDRIVLSDGDEFLVGDLPLRLRVRAAEAEPAIAAPSPATAPLLEEAPQDELLAGDVAGDEDWPSLTGAPTAPSPVVLPPPAYDLVGEPDGEIELELPDEIELEPVPGERPRTPATPDYRPRVGLGERAPTRSRQGGLLAGDLTQRPLWMQALVFLGVALLAAALCYGAYFALRMLRGAA